MKQLPQVSNIGITFKADCILVAENTFERWSCQSGFLSGFAQKGILTELVIVVSVVLVLFAIVVYKKYSNQKNK